MAGGRGPSSHCCCILGFILVIVLPLSCAQNAEKAPLPSSASGRHTSRKRLQLHPSGRSQTFRVHFDGFLHLSPSWCTVEGGEPVAGRKSDDGLRTSIISVAQSAMMQEMRAPIEVTLEPPSPYPTSTNEQEQVEAYCNQRPSDVLHDFALLRLRWIPPPDDAEGEREQSDDDTTKAAAKQLQQTVLVVHDALMTCFSLSSIAPSEDHPANSACQHPSPGGEPSALRAFYDGPFLTIRAIVPDAQITVPTTTTTRRKRRRASPPPSMAGDDGTARLPSSRRIATSGRKLFQNEAGNNDNDDDKNVASAQSVLPVHPVDILRMEELWASFPNAMGQGVHVAMLDSGLSVNNPHFTSLMSQQQSVVASCLTFTDEELPRGQQASAYCGDGVGHGTFTASVVAGQGEMVATSGAGAARGISSGGCRSSSFSRVTNNSSIAERRNRGGPKLINGVGIAPKVNLHIFKVFTDSQLSLTSWVLAALNVAMQMHIDIINLSFGGMDYYDDVFVEKIREVTTAGITVVTASGNDGPRHGSVFNPADQAEVVAVGSVAVVVETQGEKQQQPLQSSSEKYVHVISGFSSRGMTTWELPFGIGRPRPDVLGYGDKIVAASNLRAKRTCRVSSGTSMASPVVAGVLAVITSALKALQPSQILPLDVRGRTHANVALLKQIIVATADPLPLRKGLRFTIKDLRDVSVFSQGAGTINATRALTYIWPEATSTSSEKPLPGALVGAGGVDRLLRLTAYPSRIIAVSAWVSRGRSPAHRPNLWTEFLNEELFVDDAQRYPFQLKDPSTTRQQWRLHRDIDAPYLWPNILRSGGIFLTSTPLLQNMTLYSSGAAQATFGSFYVEFDANASVAFTAVTAQQQQSPTTTILSKEAASALLEVIVESHRPSLDAHVGYVTIGFWTAVPLPVRMLGARIRGTVWLSYTSSLKGSGGGTNGEKTSRTTPAVWKVGIPFVIDVTQPPPRSERLLWDTTTQLLYPSALIPRDNVREQNQFSDFAEWGGDHPHTNYVQLYEHLVVRRGLVVDLVHHRNFYEPSSLGENKKNSVQKTTHKDGTSCPKDDVALTVDLYRYLLVVDPEDFFEPSFLTAVECGVKHRGLRLLLASDWAHEGVMKLTSFVDPATNFYHEAVVGGTNVGSVNALMTKFGFVQSDHCVISGPLRGGVDGGTFLAMVTSGGCIATTTTSLQPPSSTLLQTTPSGSNLAVDSIGCSIGAREMHNDAAELRNAVGPNGKGNKRMMRNTPSVLWSSHADDSFGGALPLSLVLRRFCPPGHRYDGTMAPVANQKKRASIAIINDDDAATLPSAIAGRHVTPNEDGRERSNCGGVFFIADSDCLDGMHHYLPGGAPSSHTYCMSLLDAAMDILSSNTEFLDSATAGVLSGPQCRRLSFTAEAATTNAKKKMLLLNQSESEFHESGHLFYTSRRYRSFHTTLQNSNQHVVNATRQYRRKCGPPQRSTSNKQHQQQQQQSSSSAVVAAPIRCPVERWEVEDSLARMLQSWLDHLRREQQQRDIPVEKKNSRRQQQAGFQASGAASIFRRFLMLGLAVAILLFLWRKWLCALPGKRLRSSAARRASSFV